MIRNLPAYGTLIEGKFNRAGYTFNLTLYCPDMNKGLSIALLKTEPFLKSCRITIPAMTEA